MLTSIRKVWKTITRNNLRTRKPSQIRRRHVLAPAADVLENRTLLATFVVTSALDTVNQNDGVTTLREAINGANSSIGITFDRIQFNIGGGGPATITLNSPLPGLHEWDTIIDGRTQPGYDPLNGTPLIEINGQNLPVGAAGIYITGDSVEIYGLAINRVNGVGIFIESGATGAIVGSNHIGTDRSGNINLGNLFQGIFSRSSGALVVGNLISGNQANGIWLEGGNGNQIIQNRIGVNASGESGLGNGINGIRVANGADSNLIEGNIISDNEFTGVFIDTASFNRVQGNSIGTNTSGVADLGNASAGIRISGTARQNVIGTDSDGVGDEEEGNLISGNGEAGVLIFPGANANRIAGNRIGTNAAGTARIANGWEGIRIAGGSQSNIVGSNGDGLRDDVERNLISGNTLAGVALLDATTSLNRVAGNYIGTTANGLGNLGNNRDGILSTGTDNDIIDNVVSGNGLTGIVLVGGSQTTIAGNIVGLGVDGSTLIGNSGEGIFVSVSNNVIGTNGDGTRDEEERNLIGGNAGSGIWLNGTGAFGNIIKGNRIGTDTTGNLRRANGFEGVAIANGAFDNLVGTDGNGFSDDLESNLISGSNRWGVGIYAGAHSNRVAGNRIGTNASGSQAIFNGTGVFIASGAAFQSDRLGPRWCCR